MVRTWCDYSRQNFSIENIYCWQITRNLKRWSVIFFHETHWSGWFLKMWKSWIVIVEKKFRENLNFYFVKMMKTHIKNYHINVKKLCSDHSAALCWLSYIIISDGSGTRNQIFGHTGSAIKWVFKASWTRLFFNFAKILTILDDISKFCNTFIMFYFEKSSKYDKNLAKNEEKSCTCPQRVKFTSGWWVHITSKTRYPIYH